MEKNKLQPRIKKLQANNTDFEYQAWNSGAYLCGVDEVGRGAFAGPVVTAAVILKPFSLHNFLVDSKILSENKRNKAAQWIYGNSWYAYGFANAYEIDQIGIYQATQKAMLRALYSLFSQLSVPMPSKVIVDAMPLEFPVNFPSAPVVEHYNYGETLSISVAAASIIAKVRRDMVLDRWKAAYPTYSFDAHKAYGTRAHHNEIIAHGPTSIHRTTFIKNLTQGLYDEDCQATERSKQISLFC